MPETPYFDEYEYLASIYSSYPIDSVWASTIHNTIIKVRGYFRGNILFSYKKYYSEDFEEFRYEISEFALKSCFGKIK